MLNSINAPEGPWASCPGKRHSWGPGSVPFLPLVAPGSARHKPVSLGCHLEQPVPGKCFPCQGIRCDGLIWGGLVYSGILPGPTCTDLALLPGHEYISPGST